MDKWTIGVPVAFFIVLLIAGGWGFARHLRAELALQRGEVLLTSGDAPAAVREFSHALAISPAGKHAAIVHNDLAWIMATSNNTALHNGPTAISHATIACEKTAWSSGGILDTLAAAYARDGQFAEAAKWQRKAIEASPEYQEEFQQRLQLYQAGQAYVEK